MVRWLRKGPTGHFLSSKLATKVEGHRFDRLPMIICIRWRERDEDSKAEISSYGMARYYNYHHAVYCTQDSRPRKGRQSRQTIGNFSLDGLCFKFLMLKSLEITPAQVCRLKGHLFQRLTPIS